MMNRPKNDKISKGRLEAYKIRIIDVSLLICTLLGVIAFVISITGKSEEDHFGFYIVYAVVVSFYLAIYWFKGRLSLPIKTLSIILSLFGFVILDTVRHGVFSYSELLIIIPFFSFLVFSLRVTLIVYGLILGLFLVFGYLFVTGTLQTISVPNDRIFIPQVWIIKALFISIPSLVILFLTIRYYQTLYETLSDLNTKKDEVEDREAKLTAIFGSTNNIVGLFDKELKLIEFNQAFEEYAKATDGLELHKGIDILNQMNRPQAELFRGFLGRALKGEKLRELVEFPVEDRTTYFLLSYNPIFQEGKVGGVSMFVEDVTELKESQVKIEKYNKQLEDLVQERTEELQSANEDLVSSNEELLAQRETLEVTLVDLQKTQEQLIQAEKMASLGVLAAGVAHEINNPLNFINGGLSGLKKMIRSANVPVDNAKELFSIMEKGIGRVSEIVKSLNHFSHQGGSLTENCNIHSIIDNCLVILDNKLKERVKVTKNYTLDDIFILGNEGKLHQVFLNILSNAEHAIEGEGEIGISTYVSVGSVKVVIADDGCGISEEVMGKVQDPFFTTKDPGQGTGLGLSISYKIIEEHGGIISFSSKEGIGTEVAISLPKNKKNEQ